MKFLTLIKKCFFYLRKNGLQSFLGQIRCRYQQKLVDYPDWLIQHSPDAIGLEQQRQTVFAVAPKISIITPTYCTPLPFLVEMVESVLAQTYTNWQFCIADASMADRALRDKLEDYQKQDQRIQVVYLAENKGISGNANAAAALADGDYVAFLDHDDLLLPHALFAMVQAIQEQEADILYSDEDKIDEKGGHKLPFFKPDWSPDLLETQMYICHLLLVKRHLFQEIGGFREDYDGSQDYDLMLRLSRMTERIVHVPQILYSWRELPTSTSVNPTAKPYAQLAGLAALNDHLQSRYLGRARAVETNHLFVYDTRFALDDQCKISVIIPLKDQVGLTKKCVQSILKRTSYQNYEILLLNNGSKKEETYVWLKKITKRHRRVRVVEAAYEFNWSKLNNHGIREATGDVFIFLNNDTVVIHSDWMERLAEQAMREEIGTVGAMLLYEDGTLQHAGVVLGMNGWADHVFKGMAPVHFSSPHVSPALNRNVLASTGACLAISRQTIEQIGNFDEAFTICGSDVEISLRAYQQGLRNVYLSGVRLYHLESKSRDAFIPEGDFTMSKLHYEKYWKMGDPYFSPNLSLADVRPRLCEEERR